MELMLQINHDGISHKLSTPDGDEIDGVADIILPTLDDDNPLVIVKFKMGIGVLKLA